MTGSASVSGTNIIDIGVLGTSLMTGTYPLITASSGLNYGAFDFDVNGTMTTTEDVTLGGVTYALVLSNSRSAENVIVAIPSCVTTQPTAQTALTNSTATFTAAASGTPTPTVQWEVKIGSSSFTDVTGSFYSGAQRPIR